MNYLFSISGLRLLCEIPFSFVTDDCSREFMTLLPTGSPAFTPDRTVTFRPVETLPEGWQDGYHASCHSYLREPQQERVYFHAAPSAEPYACTITRPGDCRSECLYIPRLATCFRRSRFLWEALCVESLLLSHQALMLHAAFIRVRGQAVLFSAPSGTGKSTQADLWARYEGAEILNGDRAALRCPQDRWTAYGLPFAGSSGIYRNESAPIAAIVALRQAPYNRIRPMKASEAFRFLYPELTLHHWEADSVSRGMDLLLALLSRVPVYLLECRPDREAVETASRVIFPERSL